MRPANVFFGAWVGLCAGCGLAPGADDADAPGAEADASDGPGDDGGRGGGGTGDDGAGQGGGGTGDDGAGQGGGTSGGPADTAGHDGDAGDDAGSDDDDAGTDDGTTGGTAGSSDGSGSETGDATMAGACDPEQCVTDCGYLIPDSDEGFGPCWAPVPEYEPWGCTVAEICPEIHAYFFPEVGDDVGAAAACLLDALANDAVGRVDFWVGDGLYDDRWGSIHIVGDGTVLLDMNTGGHCGNGGVYGWHPIRTRAMSIDHDSEALTGCPGSDDPEGLLACALGAAPGIASSPDMLPWLVGDCVDADPACP